MSEKLKVKTYCINRGQPTQYYGLKSIIFPFPHKI